YFLRCIQMVTTFFSVFFDVSSAADIYTLSLHDALPISFSSNPCLVHKDRYIQRESLLKLSESYWYKNKKRLTEIAVNLFKYYNLDRKSTRLNSSHVKISYAVFCLKKKNYLTDRFCLSRI